MSFCSKINYVINDTKIDEKRKSSRFKVSKTEKTGMKQKKKR
ncbi:hypothetical protein BACFIN_06467 [Bacteroides finegoldii DSM 17565]|nr:hypothetical protein BACFIN_06467 [Bacteroides finegoldii DSM 17565]